MKSFEFRFTPLLALAAFALAGLALITSGCGTVQEGMTEEEDWTNTPSVSVTARLEYRIDSLINENRKIQQQLETVSNENRNLAARNAELENMVRAGSSASGTTTPPPPPRTASSTGGGYESALAQFRSRDFQDAINQFNALLSGGVGEDLADNCHYWIGESYFGMKRYSDAIQSFEVVTGMSGSDKADDAQFMIGNSYQSMGNKSEAKEAYQKLMSLYPSSPLIRRAKAKMGAI